MRYRNNANKCYIIKRSPNDYGTTVCVADRVDTNDHPIGGQPVGKMFPWI